MRKRGCSNVDTDLNPKHRKPDNTSSEPIGTPLICQRNENATPYGLEPANCEPVTLQGEVSDSVSVEPSEQADI